MLEKLSNTDYDTGWTAPGGSAEDIEDTVGAMVSGNTETGIAVTYDDGGGKLNFDAQTAGDVRYAPIAKGVTNGDAHGHNYQATLVSAINIKTVNGNTLLGSGDLVVSGTDIIGKQRSWMGI